MGCILKWVHTLPSLQGVGDKEYHVVIRSQGNDLHCGKKFPKIMMWHKLKIGKCSSNVDLHFLSPVIYWGRWRRSQGKQKQLSSVNSCQAAESSGCHWFGVQYKLEPELLQKKSNSWDFLCSHRHSWPIPAAPAKSLTCLTNSRSYFLLSLVLFPKI